MKKILLIGFMLACIVRINAQGNSQAVQLSHKIAKKMKDSLDLNAQQRQQIYEVNMDIHNQKQTIRQLNQTTDSTQKGIQRIEAKRDSLYLPILGVEKYQLYLQKKRNLINNN